MPWLHKAHDALVENVINAKSNWSTAFLERFLRCRFLVETGTLFKWACAQHKLGEKFPYKDNFPNYKVDASSAQAVASEAAPEVPCKAASSGEGDVKEFEALGTFTRDAPKEDVVMD